MIVSADDQSAFAHWGNTIAALEQHAWRRSARPKEVYRGRTAIASRLRGDERTRGQHPQECQFRLTEAMELLVELYRGSEKKADAAKWRELMEGEKAGRKEVKQPGLIAFPFLAFLGGVLPQNAA